MKIFERLLSKQKQRFDELIENFREELTEKLKQSTPEILSRISNLDNEVARLDRTLTDFAIIALDTKDLVKKYIPGNDGDQEGGDKSISAFAMLADTIKDQSRRIEHLETDFALLVKNNGKQLAWMADKQAGINKELTEIIKLLRPKPVKKKAIPRKKRSK